ncbi:MAG: acyl-CoA thioesterase [Candidatus Lloydbacteria bacterium]|nr:acyl-CoA thioesterase [Candidatus Lloydbacteria bacterium]
MEYISRKMIKPHDLNSANTLFGGRLLEWIDEECAVYSICKLGTKHITTKFISEIDFVRPAKQGDIIEIGVEDAAVGRTSFSIRCSVRNYTTKEEIVNIAKIVYVAIDEKGRPVAHGVKK